MQHCHIEVTLSSTGNIKMCLVAGLCLGVPILGMVPLVLAGSHRGLSERLFVLSPETVLPCMSLWRLGFVKVWDTLPVWAAHVYHRTSCFSFQCPHWHSHTQHDPLCLTCGSSTSSSLRFSAYFFHGRDALLIKNRQKIIVTSLQQHYTFHYSFNVKWLICAIFTRLTYLIQYVRLCSLNSSAEHLTTVKHWASFLDSCSLSVILV